MLVYFVAAPPEIELKGENKNSQLRVREMKIENLNL